MCLITREVKQNHLTVIDLGAIVVKEKSVIVLIVRGIGIARVMADHGFHTGIYKPNL